MLLVFLTYMYHDAQFREYKLMVPLLTAKQS
jgi:hypothetical protein